MNISNIKNYVQNNSKHQIKKKTLTILVFMVPSFIFLIVDVLRLSFLLHFNKIYHYLVLEGYDIDTVDWIIY